MCVSSLLRSSKDSYALAMLSVDDKITDDAIADLISLGTYFCLSLLWPLLSYNLSSLLYYIAQAPWKMSRPSPSTDSSFDW